MASVLYNSFVFDALTGAIDCDTDTFYGMLVTSTYVPDVDLHTKRSDVTNEVAGTGYTASGTAATVTVTKDNANNRIDVSLGAVSWPASTITARGLVYYKRRGGVATADELVGYNDFGSDQASSAGTFAVAASTARFQLP